jgi:hypothetical protein
MRVCDLTLAGGIRIVPTIPGAEHSLPGKDSRHQYGNDERCAGDELVLCRT